MAQFQIPQFIEIEDKIVGPLTLRQFIYLAAAGLFGFLLFFIFKIWLWFITVVFLGTIAAILAFVKYNGQPMHKIIFSAFKYFWRPKFYLWQQPQKTKLPPKIPEIKIEFVPSEISEKKERPLLKTLWLKINTGASTMAKIPQSILSKFEKNKEKFEMIKRKTGERQKARRIDYR